MAAWIVVVLACLSLSFAVNGTVQVDKLLFDNFIAKYNRNYTEGSDQYRYRFAKFQETLRRVQKLNVAHDGSATFGITQFADLEPSEFRLQMLKPPIKMKAEYYRARKKRFIEQNLVEMPNRMDWRDKNVIGLVRNQEQCGACWAFSTVATIESMYAIKYGGQLSTLSVQQVIDCAGMGNNGCSGGDISAALLWLNDTKTPITTEQMYPLTLRTDVCKKPADQSGVKVSAFTCHSYLKNEMQMVNSLWQHGPLAAAVDATMWQDYLGGIIKYHCDNAINHAVQIVGYDMTGPVPYYIVRNSWGSEFGLKGYIHIAIGRNACGITHEVASIDVV